MVTTEDKLGERARREERRMKRGLGEIESNKQQQPPSTQTHHTATAIDTHSLLSCVASWYVWVSKIDGIPSKGIQSINGPQGSEKRLMKRHHSCVGRASETISCYLPLQTEEPHKRPFSFFDPALPWGLSCYSLRELTSRTKTRAPCRRGGQSSGTCTLCLRS